MLSNALSLQGDGFFITAERCLRDCTYALDKDDVVTLRKPTRNVAANKRNYRRELVILLKGVEDPLLIFTSVDHLGDNIPRTGTNILPQSTNGIFDGGEGFP